MIYIMDDNSFYSIDRLIEFGMGLAMAQQMVKTMNDSMKNMYIPVAMNPLEPAHLQIYYVIIDNQQIGPLSDVDLIKLISAHKLTKDSLAWIPGQVGWQPIEKIPAILKVIALTPPPFIPSE